MRIPQGASLFTALVLLAIAIMTADASAQSAKPKPAGRVVIDQAQVAFIGSAAVGGGTLNFRGKSYPFTINGLGFGGVGVSKLRATGEVFNLARPRDLEGIYGQARIGWALASKGDGRLWLQNDKGVVLRLQSRRQGLMLAGGADAVRIQFR
ncbi:MULTISPECIES: hypothetical protein [unclassified Chelatococcus]|uniref:hypothetical protein n=1 Tax=unclassified Chelatococcus TaxID=2638111 RepID=UPI001BCF929C|nr:MULTISPECIES: hypothetical protein [unclassified Chelatococcus]CAH1660973.1 conserved exported hypothetical protein [Hyphomicrobiales bacterium]MBS7741194.1 hypothetical protein [Chelatococcus sp. HY11]MBX3545380.1 hypothetical protein [Chelatococcus sp.]MCO5078016.1 hypothetical protein [Chelatococcus sp.]CAH1683240.1 conserved exported hypothetical protein [Hyphomicrobiales bacterium]